MPKQLSDWFDVLWPKLMSATGIGYLATSYLVSHWLTRRSPARVELPSHWSRFAVESLKCRTRDGIQLRGWVIEPPNPRATIVLFHGLRTNRLQAQTRIDFLTAAGYRCVAFDHRAHGESGGHWTSFGYFERHDVEAVSELVRQRWPGEPCAALGISMGAAALCFAGEKSRAFDALILESVYHDLAYTFESRVGSDFPSWFTQFRPGIIWLTERRFGVSIREVSPLRYIEKLAPRPVLLLTGSEDVHARPIDVQLLAEQLPNTSEFHVLQGVGHCDVCELGGETYQQLILSFLQKHLFASVPSANSRSIQGDVYV